MGLFFLQEEHGKSDPDMNFVRDKMDLTFPLRRYFLHTQKPTIMDTREQYPFLFSQQQVGLWIKALGLCQGWTRPLGRAPGRPSPLACGPRL